MNSKFTGRNLARLHARESRQFMASILLVLLMGLFMALALVPAGLARQSAFHFAEARV